MRQSYLYNGNSYACKMTSLCWISQLMLIHRFHRQCYSLLVSTFRVCVMPMYCIPTSHELSMYFIWSPGPRFNIKMSSYQYRKSHCGDKTVVRSSYLHSGISYTGKMSSLYWIGAPMKSMLNVSTHNVCSKHGIQMSFICNSLWIPQKVHTMCEIWIKYKFPIYSFRIEIHFPMSFCEWKSLYLDSNFHWTLFPRVQSIIIYFWFR